MYELIRTKVDKFNIESSLNIEEIEKNKNEIDKYLISMEKIFEDLHKIDLPNMRKKELFLNGVNLKGFEKYKDGVYNVYCIDYIGLGIVKNGFLKRDVVI